MNIPHVTGNEWEYVANMMPVDLEQSAYEHEALLRRRGVKSAEDLLRLGLCYSLRDWSLRQTALWAKMAGIADISDVALMKRLHGMDDWLGHIILRWLEDRGLAAPDRDEVVHIVDGTSISGPASKGTDYRVHMGIDLARQRIISVDITSGDEGESLQRYEFCKGDIVVADRGYASRPDVAEVLDNSGHIVLRVNWQNFPLQTRSGADLDTLDCLELLCDVGQIGDWPVQLQTDAGTYDVRLIAIRKSQMAAEKEQKRLRKIASSKGRTVNPKALRAAHFTYIITDIPKSTLPAAEALELYRMRWQIELRFKRLKSILNLENLRAQKPQMARTYLYAKMLGALIIDENIQAAKSFFPWGYPILGKSLESVADHARAV